jgi:6-phosphogluconolactonase (cycloisomerase 2 family)
VFVQNDNPAGNTIVAYDRTASGGLRPVGSYPTGGKGGVLGGSVVDHLASEGSLAYDRRSGLLYAVNAGSNTLTTFTVAGDRLVRRQVLPTAGQFPVSVAVHGNLVYVLNARNGGSVSGYLQIAGVLVPIPAWHRDLHLDTSAPGQPDEFVATPGQIGFTPDGRDLVVSTKNGGNSVETFRVGIFGPARAPVVTSLPGTVPFGFTFDDHGLLVLTEAGPSAVATFRIARDGRLIQLDSDATGQAATCWIVAADDTLYASNAGSGTLSRYTTARSGALTDHGTTATDAGTVDAAVSHDGRYLYVQAGGAGVVDAYRIHPDGSLTETGSVTVPNAVGGEGIVAL